MSEFTETAEFEASARMLRLGAMLQDNAAVRRYDMQQHDMPPPITQPPRPDITNGKFISSHSVLLDTAAKIRLERAISPHVVHVAATRTAVH